MPKHVETVQNIPISFQSRFIPIAFVSNKVLIVSIGITYIIIIAGSVKHYERRYSRILYYESSIFINVLKSMMTNKDRVECLNVWKAKNNIHKSTSLWYEKNAYKEMSID